jgi:hypothetical protein
MSNDKDIFEVPAEGVEIQVQADPVEPPKPIKSARKKREMTPEQKEALLERLRKGRETAQANRKAKRVPSRTTDEQVPQKAVKVSGRAEVGPAPHGGGVSARHSGGSSEMMAEVKALRAELAEMRADKAESRRRKAEERIKKAKVVPVESRAPTPAPETPKPEPPKPVAKAPPKAEKPQVVETEQYYDARTGQIKTRPKRK